MTFAAEFGDRTLRHVLGKRLAMPPFGVLDLRESASLDGASEYDRRLGARQLGGGGERVVDLREVVSVDGQDSCAERLGPSRVRVEIPLQLGRSSLTEPVHVDDRDQVC